MRKIFPESEKLPSVQLCKKNGCGSMNPKIFYNSAQDLLPAMRKDKTHNRWYAVLRTGLWIRIHFLRIRIRIQNLMLEANTDPDLNPDPDPNPIRIQGLNDQKLKKNYN